MILDGKCYYEDELKTSIEFVRANQALPEGVPSGQADGMSSLQNSWRA
jgi:hypothetical protein